ncbi:hydrogenase nickel incorporation protein HypB [Carboxydothermus pertinax]|uniref:Hydrogenase accessory protein HypB n=1 Tax=Carboxydothermus pertinax TaxID=870242 RepID=A0A1L8CY09_9THEO|nr:hydrogenase nickel incorporation protein HypB [Carboxydothermus pertinax]GAV23783.1 hydrogenase accessory protein HypB [Carboxydothermus pertinax]
MQVQLTTNILKANDAIAALNRKIFSEKNIFVMNIISSPGAGKTTILEKLLLKLPPDIKPAVIEGDLATTKDAERIENTGVFALQINTLGGCHLDANMINQVLEKLPLEEINLLIIENVGNLVCPAGFDLGEDMKMVVLSVTEGNDKPLKYPVIFREAAVSVLNKIDLLNYVDFDLNQYEEDLIALNPDQRRFYISARTEEGLEPLIEFIVEKVRAKKGGE